MKEIKLTKGFITQVDDEDYEYLNQFKWSFYKSGNIYYVQRKKTIKGKRYGIKIHRIIMNTPNKMVVDHIDHNGLNNQKSNLRNCLRYENMRNRRSSASSGFLGVHLSRNKYIIAHININGKNIHLGMFKTKESAALAYNKAAIKYFGKFANLNKI